MISSKIQSTKSQEELYMGIALAFLGIVAVCSLVYFLMEWIDKKKKK